MPATQVAGDVGRMQWFECSSDAPGHAHPHSRAVTRITMAEFWRQVEESIELTTGAAVCAALRRRPKAQGGV